MPTPKDGLDENDDGDDDEFGDDFDDFEEGAQAGADDDFGDFDEGFQDPNDETPKAENIAPAQTENVSDAAFVGLCPCNCSLSSLIYC